MLTAIRSGSILLLLAIVSSSATAEWVPVGSNETDTLYIDPSTIRSADNKAKMWALNDYTSTQRLDDREPFMSEKTEYEYDCNGEQTRLLYFTSHSANMAEGEVVDFNVVPGEWTRVLPGSGLAILWKIACAKA